MHGWWIGPKFLIVQTSLYKGIRSVIIPLMENIKSYTNIRTQIKFYKRQ